VIVEADAPNSFPCRRCLKDAAVGDRMSLESYDPFVGQSPYSGPGPIFVHADSCEPFREDGSGLPDQLRRRLLSFRAYDANHMMLDAEVAEGSEFELVADRLFSDARVDYLHVHNARPGCFAVRVDRS
jgi:Protein of unknown function (DUF1203)